jgi:hypothetical protein
MCAEVIDRRPFFNVGRTPRTPTSSGIDLPTLRIFEMRWRNRASLNKQRGGIVSSWRREGMLILAIVAVFLVGITVGGLAFGRKSEPPLRTAFNDGTAELSFFLNGVPASRQSP